MPNGYRKCAAQYTAKSYSDGETRAAKQCGGRALKGGVYCKRHSAGDMVLVNQTHQRTPEHIAKLHAGLLRWRERMQRAKDAGLIESLRPDMLGNKMATRASKKAARERKPVIDKAPRTAAVLRAQKVLVAEIASLPALPDKPFDQMEPHEQLTALTGLGMGMLHTVLTKPIDPEGTPLLFKAQMTAASTALSVRVKVDRNMLASKKADRLVELVERLKNEKVIEN